jgi:two-component system cell cycle sensor histidine kinase/response regulator CckA
MPPNATLHEDAFSGVILDVTKRAQADEQLKQSEERYRELVETMNDGFLLLELDGTIAYVNKKMSEILGYSNEEIIDRPTIDFLDDAAQVIYENQTSKWRKGEKEPFQISWTGKNGKAVWTVVSPAPVFDNEGDLSGCVALVMDVTEMKKLEERLYHINKMESLGALAGKIAHDFNNILGIIQGYVFLLESGDGRASEFTKHIDRIKRTLEHASTLVRQILTFAQKSDVRFEAANANAVVEELLQALQATFPPNITVSADLEQNKSYIVVDQSQLYQCLLNLCINARDAMVPNGGRLLIRTEVETADRLRDRFPDASAKEYLHLSVSDTGMGIGEKIRNQIFEPFFTTKEATNGTGLGLAVVYGIVQAHKGFIDVESEVGKGTTFHFYLPLTPKTHVHTSVSANLSGLLLRSPQKKAERRLQ